MPPRNFPEGGGLDAPASYGFAITKSDETDFDHYTRAIYVGGTGDVVVVWRDDTTSTFVGVPTGTILPVRAKRVNDATTATNLVGIY